MTVLVVGGCGFIGSHIVDQLLMQGMAVRVLSRRPEAFRRPCPGVDYIMGSLADDEALAHALNGVDAVIHAASSMVPKTSNENPLDDITDNLIGSVRLLQKMKEEGVSKLVFLSSGGTVYGIPHHVPITESHPTQPISSYGIVKVAIENYLHLYSCLHGIHACVLRPSNPYGPRQGHTGVQGVIGTYLAKIARSEPIEIWGDGTVIRDFIYVEDLAELCLLAIQSSVHGVFNAGSGFGVSIAEIICLIENVVERRVDLRRMPARNFDTPINVLDISKARESFHWEPRTELKAGISKTWQWIQCQHPKA
jgi:UDP-glucose 4-epimerase